MAFNGSGVFQRLYNWANDKAAGIKIRADRMDNEMNGFATGLSTCLTKDGQTTVTANLPMATFRHTNVGNGAATNDYAAVGQVQNNTFNWCGTAGGTADAFTLTLGIAPAAYAAGQTFTFLAVGTNTVTSPTVNVSGLGAKTVQVAGSTVPVGAIVSGKMYRVTYDGTNFQITSVTIEPAASPEFSDSLFRVTDNGDATKKLAFEVSGISTGTTRTITVPNASTTLVGTDTTQTLTNKTLTTPVISTISNTGSITVPTTTGTLALVANIRVGASASQSVPTINTNTQWTGGDGWLAVTLTTTQTGVSLARYEALCDASSTPTHCWASGYFYGHSSANNASGEQITLTFPIRNNDYYNIKPTDVAGTTTETIASMYFRPLNAS